MKPEHFINTRDRSIDTGILCVVNNGQVYRGRILHASYKNIPQVGPFKNQLHKHDVYHFVFISGGSGHVVIDDDFIKVDPGWLLITSPGQAHDFTDLPGESKDYCEVTFEFINDEGHALRLPFHEVLASWSGRSCRSLDHVLVNPELQHLISKKIQYLVMTGKSQKFGYTLEIVSVLSEIFRDLFTNLFSNDDRRNQKDPINDIHDYLHKNFQKKLGLENLSNLTGLSKNYISRKYKDRFGKTPINYLHSIRIQAAQTMLVNTEYPIKQIGEIVGFEDVYFFSKVFKHLSGIPPGRYRKQHQGTVSS